MCTDYHSVYLIGKFCRLQVFTALVSFCLIFVTCKNIKWVHNFFYILDIRVAKPNDF